MPVNYIAKEISDALAHYGMPRRSGRYPWGSGEDPYQHSMDFLGRVEKLKKEDFTYTDEKGKNGLDCTARTEKQTKSCSNKSIEEDDTTLMGFGQPKREARGIKWEE